MMKTSAVVVLLACLSGVCLFVGLEDWPPPWVDEGIHINAASVLANDGRWGLRYDGRVHAFDPSVQAGPPVVAASAIGLWLAGESSLLAARWPLALLALLGCLVVAGLASRAFGPAAGLLSGVLLLAGAREPFASFVFHGRQVLGEVPALACLALGLVALAGPPRAVSARSVVAGVCLGMAMLAKGQLLVVLPVALALAIVIDATWWRSGSWRALAVALPIGLVLAGSWMLVQRIGLGEAAYREAAMTLGEGFRTQIVTGDPQNIRRAAGVLWRTGYWWWGVPALAWGLYRVKRPSPGVALEGVALLVLGAILTWFTMLSIGWARYALYVIALTVPWAAALMVAVTRDIVANPMRRWPTRVVGAAWVAGALMPFVLSAGALAGHLRSPEPTGFQQMRTFIAEHGTTFMRVETWEWEFSIDPALVTTHPGLDVMFKASAVVVAGGRLDPGIYDPLASRPTHVLQGPFGGWTGIYDDLLSRLGPPEARFGRYALYRVDAAVRNDKGRQP